MAGESAEAVATRHREKAARLERAAARWERGAEGERITASALEELGPQWSVHHDLAWPGRVRANLDHVVVGPPGLFVVDSKAWSGRVTTAGGVLRQNGRRRDPAVAAAKEAARAVGEAIGTPAIPILCFTGPVAAGVLDGVVVTTSADVVRTLSTFGLSLDDARRDAVRRRLDGLVAAGTPAAPVAAAVLPPEPSPSTAPEPAPFPAVARSSAPPARVRSAPLVPAARLRRSSLPDGPSSGTRRTARRVLPRVVGAAAAAAMFGILVVPGPRDWVSDHIYDMVAPDIPPGPDPVEKPTTKQGKKAKQAKQAKQAKVARQQARRAAAAQAEQGVAR